MTGQVKSQIQIAEAVEPFIAVKKLLGKSSWYGEGERDEGEGDEGKGKKGGRKGKGKGKRTQKEGQEKGEEGGANEQTAMDVDAPAALVTSAPTSEPPQPQKVLAIRRIDTIQTGPATFIIFSAIGYEHHLIESCRFPNR